MDEASVDNWFAAYFSDFVALGRGDAQDPRRLLAYYSVPMLVSTDDLAVQPADEAQLVAMWEQQLDAMRADGFDRTDQLDPRTELLSDTCALRRARMIRRRADGSEISRFDASYLIAALPEGLRITSLVIHSV